MAYTARGKVAAGTSAVSGTTLTVTFSAATQVGDVLTMIVACDNLSATTPTVSSVTDARATWTVMSQAAVNASAAAGVAGILLVGIVSSPHANTNTITVNLSGTVTAKAATVDCHGGLITTTGFMTVTTATSGASTTPSITTASIPHYNIVIGACAYEEAAAATADSDTTNGSWTAASIQANGGTTTSAVTAIQQSKQVSTSGAQTYNLTITSTEWVAFAINLPQIQPALLTFTDYFQGSTIDATKWATTVGTPTQNEQIDLACVLNGAAIGTAVDSLNRYSLIGSEMSVRVVGVPLTGAGTTRGFISAWQDGSNEFWLGKFGGNLHYEFRLAGVTTQGDLTWNAATMPYWQIRGTSSTIFAEYSADRLVWTTLFSTTMPTWGNSVSVKLASGYSGAETAPGSLTLDEFNIPDRPIHPQLGTRQAVSRAAFF